MKNSKNQQYFIHDMVTWLQQELLACCQHADVAVQEGWWMLEKLTGKTKLMLLTREVIELSDQQKEMLEQWVTLRIHDKKPLQYILGSVPFCGLEIMVQPPILIPRPETEEWTAWLIEKLKAANNASVKILDLCTGSGCIALALAHAFPHATVVGIDVNPDALRLAEKNRQHNRIANASFVLSDLDQGLDADLGFDIIVSNPPYLTKVEYDDLDVAVKQWEDEQALVANDDGLDFYKRIALLALTRLTSENVVPHNRSRLVIVELGAHPMAVKTIFQNAGFDRIILHKDMQGVDRWLEAHLTEVAD